MYSTKGFLSTLPMKTANNFLPCCIPNKNALLKHCNIIVHIIFAMIFQHLEICNVIACHLKI